MHYGAVVSPKQINKEGQSCFHVACQSIDVSAVNTLSQFAGKSLLAWCKMADREGNTPLHHACLGRFDHVMFIKQNRFYVNDQRFM